MQKPRSTCQRYRWDEVTYLPGCDLRWCLDTTRLDRTRTHRASRTVQGLPNCHLISLGRCLQFCCVIARHRCTYCIVKLFGDDNNCNSFVTKSRRVCPHDLIFVFRRYQFVWIMLSFYGLYSLREKKTKERKIWSKFGKALVRNVRKKKYCICFWCLVLPIFRPSYFGLKAVEKKSICVHTDTRICIRNTCQQIQYKLLTGI